MILVRLLSGWDESLVIVGLVGLSHLLLWAVAALLWERIGYKGSVEWIFLKVVERISGKRSDKLRDHRTGRKL